MKARNKHKVIEKDTSKVDGSKKKMTKAWKFDSTNESSKKSHEKVLEENSKANSTEKFNAISHTSVNSSDSSTDGCENHLTKYSELASSVEKIDKLNVDTKLITGERSCYQFMNSHDDSLKKRPEQIIDSVIEENLPLDSDEKPEQCETKSSKKKPEENIEASNPLSDKEDTKEKNASKKSVKRRILTASNPWSFTKRKRKFIRFLGNAKKPTKNHENSLKTTKSVQTKIVEQFFSDFSDIDELEPTTETLPDDIPSEVQNDLMTQDAEVSNSSYSKALEKFPFQDNSTLPVSEPDTEATNTETQPHVDILQIAMDDTFVEEASESQPVNLTTHVENLPCFEENAAEVSENLINENENAFLAEQSNTTISFSIESCQASQLVPVYQFADSNFFVTSENLMNNELRVNSLPNLNPENFAPNVVLFNLPPSLIIAQSTSTSTHSAEISQTTFPTNHLRPWLSFENLNYKDAEKVRNMLKIENLSLNFKCMGSNCDYCTNDSFQFSMHLNIHKNFYVQYDENYKRCAYCTFLATDISRLLQHIQLEHKYDHYSCTKCFYRSLYEVHVAMHSRHFHEDNSGVFVTCGRKPQLDFKSIAEEAIHTFNRSIYSFPCPGKTLFKKLRFFFDMFH